MSSGDLRDPLNTFVDATSGDWITNWQDQAYGAYLTFDEISSVPYNYGFIYESGCDQVTIDAGNALVSYDRVAAAPLTPDSLHVSQSFSPIPFETVTGIECDGASLDISSTDYTAGAAINSNLAFIQFHIQGGIAPDGEFVDYWDDTDEDGTLDARSASVIANFTDGAGAVLCSITFDASGAVPIDVSTLSPTSVDGVTSAGPLTHAYELDLVDGDGDCDSLDTIVGWTTSDPEALLANTPFVFAFGEMDATLINEGAIFVPNWAGVEDQVVAGYISTDGGTDLRAVTYYLYRDTDNCVEITSDGGILDATQVYDGGVGAPNFLFTRYIYPPVFFP